MSFIPRTLRSHGLHRGERHRYIFWIFVVSIVVYCIGTGRRLIDQSLGSTLGVIQATEEILHGIPGRFDFQKERMAFKRFLSNNTINRNFEKLPERGIITSAGSEKSLINAFVNFYVMRHVLKVDIPFMIMYWGDHESDRPSKSMKRFISKHINKLTLYDLSKEPYPAHHLALERGGFNGWKIKAYAMYAAPFKKVLFLDSDNLPLENPTHLFDSKPFLRSGNLFWPDLYCGNTGLQNEIGMPDDPLMRQTESGQMMFDREMHADVLEWVLWLNTRDEFVYQLDYGDKDTYKSAFFLAGKGSKFEQIKYGLGLALSVPDAREKTNSHFDLQGFFQFGVNGKMLFFHRISIHKFEKGKDPKPLPTMVTTPSCKYFHKRGWNKDFLPRKHVDILIDKFQCQKYSIDDIHTSSMECAKYNSALAEGNRKLPVFQIPNKVPFLTVLEASHAAFALVKNVKR